MMQDLVHTLRTLRKAPGYSIFVVGILALGIEANTAVFTLINAALLQSSSYRDAGALVELATFDRSGASDAGDFSYPHFEMLRARSRSFSDMGAFTEDTFSFSDGGDAVELQAARVSWNFFDLLGVHPAIGRAFQATEGKPGGDAVVLLTNRMWRRSFGADTRVLGRSIALDGKPYTVIGVLPASFQFGLLGTHTDVWVPRPDELNLVTPQQIQGGVGYLNTLARLRRGISLEAARSEMKSLDAEYVGDFKGMGDADPKRPMELTPLRTKLVGELSPVFLTLAAAVALVQLIACANAAGLLLTRALKRRHEVAIRIALGAARSRLVIGLLMESSALAIAAGVAGSLLGVLATRLLISASAATFPQIAELPLGVNGSVLLFALSLSLFTGVLFGLGPALHFSSGHATVGLREEGRGTTGSRSRALTRSMLVAGQIALSLILLVGAGLLIQSFIQLQKQPMGFNTRNVLTMQVALPPTKYPKREQIIQFFDELVRRGSVTRREGRGSIVSIAIEHCQADAGSGGRTTGGADTGTADHRCADIYRFVSARNADAASYGPLL